MGGCLCGGSQAYRPVVVLVADRTEPVLDRTEQSLGDKSENSKAIPTCTYVDNSKAPEEQLASVCGPHVEELQEISEAQDAGTSVKLVHDDSMDEIKVVSVGLAVTLVVVFSCLLYASLRKQQRATPRQTTLAVPPMTAQLSTTLRSTHWLTPSPDSCQVVTGEASSCSLSSGPIRISGYRAMHVLKAGANKPGWPVGEVEAMDCDKLKVHRQGRAYLAETCGNKYSNRHYSAIDFRGKTIRYSIDLGSAGCGCIAAFYLVSMRQNTVPGACEGDFYCDANKVCGPSCSEVDIMEANFKMWKTTLHTANDTVGLHSAVVGHKYGPGSACIDTGQPFQVAASVDKEGSQVLVTLSQRGCSAMALVEKPQLGGSFRNGMTPVISYWFDPKPGSSRWFDGAMCDRYNPKKDCGPSVMFSNFSIEDTSVMVSW